MADACVGAVQRTKFETEIEWKILDFFSIPDKVGEWINSHSFSFGGGTWYIRLYPNGRTEHLKGYTAIFLGRKDKGSPIPVTFTFSLKAYGILKELYTCPYIGNPGWVCGSPCALKRSKLLQEKAQLAPSDCLTVVCLLTMHQELITASENVVDATTQTSVECCIGKLSRDLNELLVIGEDSDMTVRVKEEEFRLHRGIMGARVPVFHSMLRHEMREKTTGTVCIDDCEVDVFQAFVDYVYSGRVDKLCTDTVFDLFVLADKYQVDELTSACLDVIKRTLSVDTFCDVVTLALTYDKKELLQQAIDFLAGNMAEIMKTVKWMSFMKERHIQANELLLKAISKK